MSCIDRYGILGILKEPPLKCFMHEYVRSSSHLVVSIVSKFRFKQTKAIFLFHFQMGCYGSLYYIMHVALVTSFQPPLTQTIPG